MRRISKTIISALLVVTLLFGTVVYAADNNQASSRSTTNSNNTVTLYENNFDNATIDTLQAEGWSGLNQYDMSNGALRGKNANAYYSNADAYNWTDYTYETKMTIATKNASNTVDGYFGIRFGVNSSGTGIEYGIRYKSTDGSFAYRVYDRINKQFLIAETSLSGKGIALDKQMTLKVEAKADTFTIYLNGENLGSATLSNNVTGTVGTLMSTNTVYLLYDDIKVTKAATVNTTTLYENNFDEATIDTLTAEGWTGLNQYDMSNDALRGKNANAFYNNATAYSWTDYTYETKMTIATKNTSNTVDGYFGIRFNVNSSGNGIEYGIHYKSSDGSFAYRVYDRINKQFLIAETSLSGKGIALDKQMTLKVEAKADTFTVYLNGENLGSATLSDDVTGTVGTLMSANTVYLLFDDMRVTKEVVVDPNLYYQNNFDEATIDTLTAEGWTGLNQYDMSNGALRGKNANAYYNNADAYNWTNYTYETKMTIATKNASNSVNGYLGIRFNVGSDGNGIEYGIHYNSSDNSFAYRVYDRRTSGESNRHLIAETSLDGKGLALDKQMTLKVKVEGTSFTVYLNDEELGKARLSTDVTGTIGTLMSTNTVYLLYDDMLVTKTETASQEPGEPISMKLEFDQDEIKDGATIYVDSTIDSYTISGTLRADDENATMTINGESALTVSQTQQANLKQVSEYTQVEVESQLTDVAYLDVRDTSTPLAVYGLYNYSDKNQDTFVRMKPSVAEAVTSESNREQAGSNVWGHNRETSGGRVRFSTDSDYIAIQAYLPNISTWGYGTYQGMENVSFDLYIDTESGSEYYGTFKPQSKMTEAGMYESVIDLGTKEKRNITIYFPILNPVKDVYIGVSEEAKIGNHEIAYADTGKIVWYGSSITQGGSVSSPSKTYAATVSRKFNKDFLNLGFWGSANGQEAIANYIADMDDIGVFVLDYDHNESDATTLQSRHMRFYEIVRNAHPNIPIIMISRPNHQAVNWADMRDAIKANYKTAVDSGDTNVYFIDGQSFFEDTSYDSCLMDGVHPSDLGAGLIAEGIISCYQSNLGTKEFRFSKEIALQEGANTVQIKAQDANTDEITMNLTIVRTDELTLIDEDFNSYNDGDKPINTDNGWKQANSNAVVGSGRLLVDKSANLFAKDDFVDGYVSADISIEEASDVLKQAEVGKTVYPVWLTARNTYNADTHEFRARIALTKQAAGEYTAKMQVIVYSSSDYTLPQTYSYDIADFELGKIYSLKVLCVGNYFAVEMDGAVLYEGACSTTHGLYNREGSFGLIAQGNTAAISVDNVKIVKYTAKQLTVHEDCAEEIFTESYPTLTMGGSETYTRTAFHVGEHVEINVIPKDGYSLDKDSLKYTTKAGEIKIVDHASEVLYGFFMPAYDAVVSAEFVKGGSSASDIYFTENFDGENSLIDNGWDNGGNISKGALVLDVDETAWSYVTGFYGASEWTDYVVEADVRVNEENEDHNVGVASISARTSGVMTGYEFGIQIATGSQRGIFRLYDRTTKTFLAQSANNLAERNTTYKLKMVLQGNHIICFVNGQLMFDITDAAKSNTVGTIGLRSLGGNGSYDNIVVRKVLPADLEGSASTSTIVGGKTSPTTGDIAKTFLLWSLCIVSGMAIVIYGGYHCNKLKWFSKRFRGGMKDEKTR